ncbi:MAG: hypothetical protein LBT46_03325, partial [Planctomycetaceae bacterium]|nr:hypothetical protein [Planctomycetaceae bacterium]
MPLPPFSVFIEPANPLPTHTAQPQPADEATNDSNGDGVLGGVLGGGAGLVIGTMIARKIVL